MDTYDPVNYFVKPIHDAGMWYMISGSIAAMQYGEPRYTGDVDVVISISPAEAAQLASIFPESDYYCPPIGVILVELKRPERAHFNLIHIESGLKADFYPSQTHSRFDWAKKNRRMLDIHGTGFWFAPPEYVILRKLEYYREGGSEKHLRDIRSMLVVQGDRIDRAFIASMASELGLIDQWEIVKRVTE